MFSTVLSVITSCGENFTNALAGQVATYSCEFFRHAAGWKMVKMAENAIDMRNCAWPKSACLSKNLYGRI